MKPIVVTIAETARDGVQFKWVDRAGVARQQTYKGRNTRNKINAARDDLEAKLNKPGATRRWSDFEKRVKQSFFSGMTPKGQGKPKTMLRRFKETLAEIGEHDIECAEITEEIVLLVKERMESEGLAKMTIRTNMGALWAILNWGAENNLLPRLYRPRERVRKSDRVAKKKSKGRSLTMEEIDRMIEAVKTNPVVRPNEKPYMQKVRKDDESAEAAIRAIHVARLTGMRLEDAHWFCWEPREDHHYPVNLDGKSPMLSFSAEQKSGEDESIPLTPMAVEYLRSIQQEAGYVCRMSGRSGEHQTSERLGRIIANAGRAAGIVVKRDGGKYGATKYASAHDLRRTFGRFLLDHVNLKDAQTMMRHASFETLMRYYSDSSEDALALKLKTLFTESSGFSVDAAGAVFAETQ